MLKIQAINEISTRLTRLRTATAASVGFDEVLQLVFEDNRHVPALTEYCNAIRTVGRLGERYVRIFERDISGCERIIENTRALDRQAHKK